MSSRTAPVLFVLLGLLAPAAGATASSFEIALGLKATAPLTRRGATFYDAAQLTPLLFVSAFEGRLLALPISVEYNDFLAGRWLRGRAKVEVVSDEPLYRTGEPVGIRNARPMTLEATQALELFAPSFDDYRFGLEFRWVQDILRHGGTHFELTPRLTLASLGEDRGRPRVQPQAFATLGLGGAAYNRYYYGPEARAGFNYYSAGLRVLLPGRYDPAFSALEIAHYEVLGEGNRGGSLLGGKRSGWRIEAIVAFRVR